MDRHDAVKAVELIAPKHVIPCHYDTFPPVETDAEAFKADVESGTSAVLRDPRPGRVGVVRGAYGWFCQPRSNQMRRSLPVVHHQHCAGHDERRGGYGRTGRCEDRSGRAVMAALTVDPQSPAGGVVVKGLAKEFR